MRNLWNSRDLPVLRAYAELDAEGQDLLNAGDKIAQTLGLDRDGFERAVRNLGEAGYLRAQGTLAGSWVTGVTERGMREAGSWPSEQTALDRMLAALDAIAENTNDDDTRSKAQKFAQWLRSSGTTVGLAVASAAITGQLPGSG